MFRDSFKTKKFNLKCLKNQLQNKAIPHLRLTKLVKLNIDLCAYYLNVV